MAILQSIALLLCPRTTIPLICLQAITLFNSTFRRCLRILIPIYYPAMIKRSLRDNPVTHDRTDRTVRYEGVVGVAGQRVVLVANSLERL